MVYAKVSYVMTDEVKAAIETHLAEINAAVGGMTVSLTMEERISFLSMGPKTVAFVDQALKYAKKHPEFVPPYLNVDDFEKDYNLATDMRNLLRTAEPVVEKISDTYLAAGTDAFTSARTFYESVKAAAKNGVPGADSLVAELKKRFYRKPAPKPGDEEKNQNDEEKKPIDELKEVKIDID